jgi:hypothetical protein
MDKFKTQERELIKRNCMLAEYLKKEHERKEQETERVEQVGVIGLPVIEEGRKSSRMESSGKTPTPKHGGRKSRTDGMVRMERRGSVSIQLLHVVGSMTAVPRNKPSDSEGSRPSTAGVKLPPLREELAAKMR